MFMKLVSKIRCELKLQLQLQLLKSIYIDSVFMILPWNLYVADSILPFVQINVGSIYIIYL